MTNDFDGRNNQSTATTVDLTILFNQISDHFYENHSEFTRTKNDLKEDDDHALAVLFKKMEEYYRTGEGDVENPYASDLWIIYDSLATAFGLTDQVWK